MSQWVNARSIKRADLSATRGNALLFALFLDQYSGIPAPGAAA